MTDEKFKAMVTEYKVYLKPALFTILMGNAGVFSDQTKKEIVAELKNADKQMKDLYEYQVKRNKKMEKWVKRFGDFYGDLKAQFRQMTEKESTTDKSQAEHLISNL